jgi:hypothetical protein
VIYLLDVNVLLAVSYRGHDQETSGPLFVREPLVAYGIAA